MCTCRCMCTDTAFRFSEVIIVIRSLHSGIDQPKEPAQIAPFASYSEVLDKFTKFSALQELPSFLKYEGTVTSTGFDRDWETLAVAGLAKKIQICDKQQILCSYIQSMLLIHSYTILHISFPTMSPNTIILSVK